MSHPEPIFTNHALEKMSEHSLEKWEVEKAFYQPDRKEWSPIPDCQNFIRVINDKEVGVIARKKGDGVWKIISVWKRKVWVKR